MRLQLATAALLLVVSTTASAGELPLYQPPPAWVAASPPIDAAKAAAVGTPLVRLDVQEKLGEGGLWSFSDTATRAISAEALGELGTLTLQWHPSKGDLIIHRAEIIRGAEQIDLLANGKEFTVLRREELLEQQQLTGILTATMSVEGLRVGDILRLSYSVTQRDPALAGRLETRSGLIANPVLVQQGRYRLLWPRAAAVRWKSLGEMPKSRPVSRDGFQEIVIPLPLPKQPEMPSDAPSRFRRAPMFAASSFADWVEVSKVAAPLYDTSGLIPADSPLAREAARIAAAHTGSRERIAAALRLVQDQVRYLFVGMDSGNLVPQSPTRTWEARFGDCKAKTLLLLALLHAMDIDAEAVLADLGSGDGLADELPAFGAFDHVLVRARADGRTFWLDGTSSGARVDDLEDTPLLGYVLPVRHSGAGLEEIRTRPVARPHITAEIELDQSAGISFPVPYKLTVMARGPGAESAGRAAATLSPDQLRETVFPIANPLTNNGSVVSPSITFDEASGSATIRATGLANIHWRKDGGRRQIVLDRAVSSMTFEPERGRATWQNIPAVTSYPMHTVFRTRLRLPYRAEGFTLAGDAAYSGTLAGLDVERTTRLDGDWLVLDQRIAARDREIPAAEIGANRAKLAVARNNVARVEVAADYPGRWEEIRRAKAERKFEPILALLDQTIREDPDDGLHYRNRATFLVAIYERKKALADLDQLIGLEPTEENYVWRAMVRADLGDWDGAVADLEAARRLDPSSNDTLSVLANLLMDRGEPEKALVLVEERLAVAGKDRPTLLALKADVLGRSGKIEQAMQTIDQAVESSPGNPTLLNNRCWLKGLSQTALDGALKDCTKAIELMESPLAALDSRAMVYFRLGRLDEALADLNAAYDINSSAAAVLFLRGIVRDRMGDKAGEIDLRAAREMYPRIGLIYAHYGIKP